MTEAVLTVENLQISSASTRLVHGVSLAVQAGEIVGLVGESGSGKTLSTLAMARLLPSGLSSTADRLEFYDQDLTAPGGREIPAVLGTRMAMVFQDPMSSLNPAMRIGAQMVEASRVHLGYSRKQARAAALRSLEDVQIPDPERRLRQYPHELSGGMRQRVMIAMGLMSQPALLIADEPTTALDVTVQAQVMSLLRDLNADRGTAILLVSHNIALLSEICDRVLVMYRGHLVDDAPVDQLTAPERHPYTRALIGAVPDLTTDRSRDLVDVPEFAPEGGGRVDA
jgi:ABC-type dipeptide/oligopeptide/nickel transport system ATPase component